MAAETRNRSFLPAWGRGEASVTPSKIRGFKNRGKAGKCQGVISHDSLPRPPPLPPLPPHPLIPGPSLSSPSSHRGKTVCFTHALRPPLTQGHVSSKTPMRRPRKRHGRAWVMFPRSWAKDARGTWFLTEKKRGRDRERERACLGSGEAAHVHHHVKPSLESSTWAFPVLLGLVGGGRKIADSKILRTFGKYFTNIPHDMGRSSPFASM